MALKYSSVGGGTGTGFNVQITSKYSYATFLQAQPAGSYTIKSAGLYTNWDVYLLDASNNLVAYTGGAAVNPSSSFSAIVILNGTYNDILQFSFQSTVIASAETTQIAAGPFITAATPTSLPNQNSTITVTGGNFATGVTATFTGSDLVPRTAKGIVRNSASSIVITRPDSMPATYSPYTLTLGNPGINNPTNSSVHIFSGITVGVAPVWQTSAVLPVADLSAYSTTVVATDADAGSSISYSYVSGSLPSGISFNSSTGVISGTYNGSTTGAATYTIRATDAGGNTADRTFTLPYTVITGGTLVSDSTYYYRVFKSNGTLAGVSSLSADLFVIGGGGGGASTIGGGGGAGGVAYSSSQSLTGSYTVTIGAGSIGSGYGGGSYPAGYAGTATTFGSLVTAYAGGGGGGYNTSAADSPSTTGSGGGGTPTSATHQGGYPTSTGQGNNGGSGDGNGNNGGGGGGAGGVGGSASSSNSGAGGSGTNTYSSWLTAISSAMSGVSGWSSAVTGGYIAGGGSGGSRQGSGTNSTTVNGGGGIGTTDQTQGGAGTPNTGGGGGGGGYVSNPTAGGLGGSGLVIVRYTRASIGG